MKNFLWKKKYQNKIILMIMKIINREWSKNRLKQV